MVVVRYIAQGTHSCENVVLIICAGLFGKSISRVE